MCFLQHIRQSAASELKVILLPPSLVRPYLESWEGQQEILLLSTCNGKTHVTRLFLKVHGDRTRGNRHKLDGQKLQLSIGKELFTPEGGQTLELVAAEAVESLCS